MGYDIVITVQRGTYYSCLVNKAKLELELLVECLHVPLALEIVLPILRSSAKWRGCQGVPCKIQSR